MTPRVGGLSSWHDDWSGLSAVVLGLGDTGFAIADTLVELGAHTSLWRAEVDDDRDAILEVLGVSLHTAGLERPDSTPNPELVVVAPEWGANREVEQSLRDRGAVVWSDVEFACRVVDKIDGGPHVVFLPPTESSPLVSEVAESFLLAGGLKALRVGVGYAPALDAIRLPDGVDVVLWQLTIDQLERMADDTDTARRPQVTVSIDDDEPLPHSLLLELYRETVHACIYRRGLGASERAVEDAWVVEGARAIGVGRDSPGMSDFGRVDTIVCDRAFLDDRAERALELCTTEELDHAGFTSAREIEAVIAAMAIARAFSIPPEVIGGVLRQWEPSGE